jgi:hypothetical protein
MHEIGRSLASDSHNQPVLHLGDFGGVEQVAELSTFEIVEMQPGESAGLGGQHVSTGNEAFG